MINKQYKILDEAIKSVPFDGWSDNTLRSSAKLAGFDENYAQIAFKNGSIDAISLFFNKITDDVLKKIDTENLNNMKIRERIFYILDTRFSIMKNHKPAIRKTLQFLAMPQNVFAASKLLWEVTDKIWYLAGDKSSDFNYYTKRTTLMAVYSTSLLFWLNDESDDHADTKQFLQHRIDNVMQFEKLKGSVKSFFEKKVSS